MDETEKLRYPIGKFVKPQSIGEDQVKEFLKVIQSFPEKMRQAIDPLTEEQLNTSYRPGGWTIRQVVHHCADSHLNAFIRLKLALTEETPTVKPYFEERWAELPDSIHGPVDPSLKIIEGIHFRWFHLAQTVENWSMGFYHPEQKRIISLGENLAMYAWHSNHHLGHIKSVKFLKDQ